MKEYRKVAEFYYNRICYIMYIDNKNKHFFLKKNDNEELEYISIKELLELTTFFKTTPRTMMIEKGNKKKKLVPKILISSGLFTLTLSVFSSVFAVYQQEQRVKEIEKRIYSSPKEMEEDYENYISYNEPEQINKPDGYDEISEKYKLDDEIYEADTYYESDWLGYINIYDMDYLDKALDYDIISIDILKDVISKNSSINDKYKKLLCEYCDRVYEKYPDIEMRVLYENLKTLEVVECSKEDLVAETLNFNSYGCYNRMENKIYVLKDNKYEKGTWEYQVIFHELSHCMRTGIWEKDGKDIRVQVEGVNFNNEITAEALNSLFTVSLFDYEEKNIAYQLQSNYHSIMIECMDNYTLKDYIQHSISYYAKKLDEHNNDENYSTVILELMQMQHDDYNSENIYVEQKEFYPIYDYVSKMYYRKNINNNMSYSEAKNVTDTLLNRILYDVPEEYNIDVNHFYDYLDEYCDSIGIEKNNKKK